MKTPLRFFSFGSSLILALGNPASASHPSQGLWVGDVALNAVNEATGAVGNSNTYEFKNPDNTTSTSDTADLRLILHVNGAGQVSLLKSVAIVTTNQNTDGSAKILLITDPSLYPQFPGIAKRIASASFDFGNQSAVNAVQTIIDNATNTAVDFLIANPSSTVADIQTQVATTLNPVVSGANVSLSYLNRATGKTSFITSHFFSEQDVITLANTVALQIHNGTKRLSDFAFNPVVDQDYQPFASDPLSGTFNACVSQAKILKAQSFYADTRGLEAIAGVVYAAASAAHGASAGSDINLKQSIARSAAIYARHNAADTVQAYNRFLAGNAFLKMRAVIPDLATTAAIAAKAANMNKTEIATSVRDSVSQNADVSAAYTAAETLRSESLWSDIRSLDAVNSIVATAAEAAAEQVMNSISGSLLKSKIEEAMLSAALAIPAAPVFRATPSTDYTGFVSNSNYSLAATTAAKTAATEVAFQYNAGVRSAKELRFYANRAVTKALTSTREAAAVIPQHEIRLLGNLAPGATLEGSLHLPALAPTNPFMHRRHPDHTEGFPITRRMVITMDPTVVGNAGYGVSTISGSYFEEIHGLHKPLGPSQNIGLRTRGVFTLNRISIVDTLNF